MNIIIEPSVVHPVCVMLTLVCFLICSTVVLLAGFFVVSVNKMIDELAPYEDAEDFELAVAQEVVKKKDASLL